MFKWVCLLVAVIALATLGWMVNDMRLQVREQVAEVKALTGKGDTGLTGKGDTELKQLQTISAQLEDVRTHLEDVRKHLKDIRTGLSFFIR